MTAVAKETELRKRVVTAFFLSVGTAVLLALSAINKNFQLFFSGCALVAVVVAAWEFSTFCRFQYQNILSGFMLLLAHCMPPVLMFLFIAGNFVFSHDTSHPHFLVFGTIPYVAIFGGVLLSSIYWLREINKTPRALNNLADELLAGIILFSFGSSSLVYISLYWEVTLWLLLVVAVNDSAAYFVGKSWGITKIAPQTSPGKTVIGSIAGLFFGLIFAAFLPRLLYLDPLFTPSQSLCSRIIISTLLGFFCIICAQITDLLKSHCKRIHSVKDSGTILPGHGGVLDRIDGLLGGAIAMTAGLSLLSAFRAIGV
jgi:phosphatidate cytidylyltransferase